MKSIKCLIKRRIAVVLMMAVALLLQILVCTAQNSDIEQSIASIRKGELIIKAKPGSKISVEQVAHEFWFGCAIPDGIFNGSASKSDKDQFKEKFLKNFNSAVTEML